MVSVDDCGRRLVRQSAPGRAVSLARLLMITRNVSEDTLLTYENTAGQRPCDCS